MPYDEDLAHRVRAVVARGKGAPAIEEKRMFGGLAFLVNGNMAVAVRGGGGLMVRVDRADSDRFAAEPGAQETEMRGRLMPGWLTVDSGACASDADLRRWVQRGIAYAKSLPPK